MNLPGYLFTPLTKYVATPLKKAEIPVLTATGSLVEQVEPYSASLFAGTIGVGYKDEWEDIPWPGTDGVNATKQRHKVQLVSVAVSLSGRLVETSSTPNKFWPSFKLDIALPADPADDATITLFPAYVASYVVPNWLIFGVDSLPNGLRITTSPEPMILQDPYELTIEIMEGIVLAPPIADRVP